ncbi:MAG: efflux RND transporter periplasmic adaptor subunit [Burkholderiales bacterium]|nr:efflux RND transporter periplasmic adaptor subunit [Burkholderiales bacterium]
MKKIVLSLLSCSVILVACGKKELPKGPEKHVDVAIAKSADIPYVFDYPAIVQGVIDYPVIPRVSGAIFKQYYTEGTYVKKDTILYQIDPRPYQYDLQTYQGNLVRDQAALDNYKLIYERYLRLYKVNAVSLQDVETADINYKSALGNVQTDIANINQQRLNLEYCQVRAPADGYIAERQVTVGDMVSAWQTTLNQINSVNDMYIQFSMPENDRLTIEQGVLDKTMVVPKGYKFRTDLQLADGTIIKNEGYVQFSDTRISLQNGVWNLRAYVDNIQLKHKLLAGQFIHIYLHGANFINTYAIPQVAIFRDDTGPFVYELDNKNAVIKKRITTGKMVGDLWIVTSGLTDGEKIIVNGGLKVNVGDKVIVDATSDNSQTGNAKTSMA